MCVCARTRMKEDSNLYLSYSQIQCSYQVSYLNTFMLTNVDINIVRGGTNTDLFMVFMNMYDLFVMLTLVLGCVTTVWATYTGQTWSRRSSTEPT